MHRLRFALSAALLIAGVPSDAQERATPRPPRADRADPKDHRRDTPSAPCGMPVITPSARDSRMVIEIDPHAMTMPVARFHCGKDPSRQDTTTPPTRRRPRLPRVQPVGLVVPE